MVPPRKSLDDALVAQARLAGRVAHAFNNYLAVIIANLEMAMEDATSGRCDPALIDLALGAARRAVETCRMLQDFARPAGAPPSPHSLRAILATLAESLRHIEITGTGGDIAILAEESELLATLHALANQPGTFVSKKGRLIVSEPSDDPEWILLTMEGDGPPLPREALPDLFEPIIGHRDIDLSRAWSRMRRAGGLIDAGLNPEGRLTVHLRLPRAPPDHEGAE